LGRIGGRSRSASHRSICVYDKCNENNSSYTYLDSTYVNDTGIAQNQVLTGEQYFTVKEMKVFTIKIESDSFLHHDFEIMFTSQMQMVIDSESTIEWIVKQRNR
jgi:hypothetical protein